VKSTRPASTLAAPPPPFAGLSPRPRRRAFLLATAATLAVGAGLAVVGAPLATEAAPRGIVSFELAGDLESAERILASWDREQRVRAGISLGADFLFLLAYPLALALACAGVAGRLAERAPRAATLGALLAWGQALAGALDAVENWALIELLLGSRHPLWPALAAACAAPKFALVGAGLAYAGIGGLASLALRGGRSP